MFSQRKARTQQGAGPGGDESTRGGGVNDDNDGPTEGKPIAFCNPRLLPPPRSISQWDLHSGTPV
uniref:WGS project CBMI000000000 data, contig CS3069_c003920 n=1 Tax=Fusarium clavum TaxID=2594811 RepID=A0A090ME39_9HYPO|nr:unnamed protein product [Fusarium clavum]